MRFETMKIADLISEISMGPFGSNIKVDCFVDDGIPVLNGSNLEGFVLKEESFRFVTEEKADSLKKANAHRGDVVITHRGTLGQIVFIPKDSLYDRYVISQSQFRLRCNDKILPEYLVYYFHTRIGQHKLLSNASQVGVPALARASTTFQTIEIEVPDMDIQRKIVDLLEAIRRKVEINSMINENLLHQAQAVFVHTFKETASTTPATIADIAINVTDGVHNTVKDDPEGQYFLLSCKNIKGGSLNIGSSERKINSETFEKLRRRTKLAKGDILISSVGTVGELLLLNTEPSNFEFQRSVAIIKPNPEIVSSAYVYEALVDQKAELINTAHGAVQQCLFISDISEFPIGIPNPDSLRSFDEIVLPMFDIISKNEAENTRLAGIRDVLLPRLMSGDLDVSTLDL